MVKRASSLVVYDDMDTHGVLCIRNSMHINIFLPFFVLKSMHDLPTNVICEVLGVGVSFFLKLKQSLYPRDFQWPFRSMYADDRHALFQEKIQMHKDFGNENSDLYIWYSSVLKNKTTTFSSINGHVVLQSVIGKALLKCIPFLRPMISCLSPSNESSVVDLIQYAKNIDIKIITKKTIINYGVSQKEVLVDSKLSNYKEKINKVETSDNLDEESCRAVLEVKPYAEQHVQNNLDIWERDEWIHHVMSMLLD